MKFLTASFLALLCLAAPLFAEDNINIITEDKWKISSLYEPAGEKGKVIILLHDLGKTKQDYKTLKTKLKDAGFGYLALDLRGHGQSTNLGVQKDFNKAGTDNEFNQMVRDITAAIAFLNQKKVATSKIYIAGAGLGANVAAKSIIFNPNIAGIALLTPSLKTRDVLTMNGIKINKKPVFIAVSSEDRKQMMEASFIRNAAFLASGQGKVTFMTAYNLKGVEMVDKYLTDELLQWFDTPQLPEVKPDVPVIENTGDDIILLTPSVL